MSKDIIFDREAQRRFARGVDKLADALRCTLGPAGRNVVLQLPDGRLLSSNDGATIAAQITLEDPFENMGAQLVGSVAAKTNDAVGDGTTTASLLAQYIVQEGFRSVAAGAEPLAVMHGIQGAAQVATAALQKLTILADTPTLIRQVATVSAKDAVIGDIVSEAIEQVGADGVVNIEDGGGLSSELKVELGMQFDRGFLSPEMADDRLRSQAQLERPLVLITDQPLTNPTEIAPLLDAVIAQGRPLLIIAEEVKGAALATLLLNKKNAVLNAVAIHPPAYGEGRQARMDDLAVFCGATFISKDMGRRLGDATIEMLGSAKSATVTSKNTVIVGDDQNAAAIAKRIAWLKHYIANTDYDFARQQLEERLAKLAGGVATIAVGATTESEMKEKRLKYGDAVKAAQAAKSEGILPGGGIAYLACMPAVEAYAKTLAEDQQRGATILLAALEQPTRQIAKNAGLEDSRVMAAIKAKPRGTGFDAAGGQYLNMLEAGIIDAAKVSRLALQSAASAASVLLSTAAGVANME